METLRELKNKQRRLCIAARRTLTASERAAFSRIIYDILKETELVRRAKTIFSYMAAWDEADLSFLHEWADTHRIQDAADSSGFHHRATSGQDSVNLAPAIRERTCDKSSERKRSLCFPLTYPNGIMEAAIPKSPAAFRIGPFGILSPDPVRSRIVSPEDLDLILVPCVGFDEDGNRLGHGAGYYDRYLQKCPRAVKILIAFEAQKMNSIAVEQTDIPMDYVVTEKGLRQMQH